MDIKFTKEKYKCDICGLEVKVLDKENYHKLSLELKEDNNAVQSFNICEVCAKHIAKFISQLSESGKEFYKINLTPA